jgi:hypothetical protein
MIFLWKTDDLVWRWHVGVLRRQHEFEIVHSNFPYWTRAADTIAVYGLHGVFCRTSTLIVSGSG